MLNALVPMALETARVAPLFLLPEILEMPLVSSTPISSHLRNEP